MQRTQLLHLLLISQLFYITAATSYILECTVGGEVIELNEREAKPIATKCATATHITLFHPDVFIPGRMTDAEVNTILNISHIDMCMQFSRTHHQELKFKMKKLTGKCKGPLLEVTMNEDLNKMEVGDFLSHLKNQPDSVRVRGNRLLTDDFLKKFEGFRDVQRGGECAMPRQLGTHVDFEDCTHLYGPLVVGSNVRYVEVYGTAEKFDYTGCIKISDTKLVDISFLESFQEFTTMSNCDEQYITRNEELCINYPSVIRSAYPGTHIYDNSKTCGEYQCDGGVVSESYLDETAECTTRIGDVIISQWNDKPPNIDNLYKTTEIQGRLIIKKNKGLGDFDYFKNLEKVGTPSIPGREPAITILNNEDLTSLDMPMLDEVMQKESEVRVKIGENKLLEMSTEEVNKFIAAAGGTNHADIQFIKRKKRSATTFPYIKYIVLPVILLLVCLLLFFVVKKKAHFGLLPPPPIRLPKKSQAVLAGMCKEILKNNPMVWRILDRQLIWKYSRDDPQRVLVSGLAEKHSNFLKNYRAELIPNARIPMNSERVLSSRIQSIISQPLILMIGTDDDISNIVPSLPNDVGGSYEYESGDSTIKFTLTTSKYIGEQTLNYVYKVVVQRKGEKPVKKKVHVLLYVWDSLRLPIEFEEIFQVLRYFAKKKPICLSNRRKEVFSMLHLVFTYVFTLCEPIGVTQAFQLHTDTCNGAPLDNNEMLMVMAFILEWAHQSFSVPQDLLQKHADWCHTYARMSGFSKEHRNIINIRPDHLVTSRREVLQKEIEAAGRRPGSAFSERPEEAVVDKVRRRTEGELKEKQKEQATASQKKGEKKEVVPEEEDTDTNVAPDHSVGTFSPKRYRAGPDDPFRIAEEKRIAEALKKRTQMEGIEKTAAPKMEKTAAPKLEKTAIPKIEKTAPSKTVVQESARIRAAGSGLPKTAIMPKSSIKSIKKSIQSVKRKKSDGNKAAKSQSHR